MRALGFFALGLVAFASAPQAAVNERPEFTPFEPGHSDIVLAARLNGRGPFRFLLDTGSTHTAMSAETDVIPRAPSSIFSIPSLAIAPLTPPLY